MDRSGDNTSDSSQAGNSVVIKDCENLYLATNLTVVNILPESYKEGCGCDWLSDSEQTACRWTQTIGLLGSTVHCTNFNYINMYVNEEVLSEITSEGEMFWKKLSERPKALCRFGYDGDMTPMDQMSAVKIDMIKVKDGMKQLIEDVAGIVRKGSDKTKLVNQLKEAVRKCALLIGVDLGSLVFIFKHSSLKHKELELKTLVCGFLPDWVKEEDLVWEFRPCAPDEHGVNAKLSNAIQLTCPQSDNEASVDSRIERLLEKKIEPYISSIRDLVTKTHEEVIQRFTKQHQDALHTEMQTFLQQVTSQLQNLLPLDIKHQSHEGPSKQVVKKIIEPPQSFSAVAASAIAENVQGTFSGDYLYDSGKSRLNLKEGQEELDVGYRSGVLSSKPQPESYSGSFDRKYPKHGHRIEADLDQDGDQSFPYKHEPSWKPQVEPISDSVNKEYSMHGPRSGADLDQDSAPSGDEPKVEDPPPKSQQSKMLQAEQLLNWVNVKSKASQSDDQEIQRMMEQVELALQDEDKPSPRARTLDTVLVLDTSDSVVEDSLDELKTVVHTFIDSIETNVDTMNLEENLAVVQISGRAWVRQHLTNDYNRIRDVVDEMTPESKTMPTGGRTPLFQALLVCLGAIEGRGGVVNVAGCHRVRPRLIFFSDGRPTDEATDIGGDMQSNVNEVKYALVQLITEFASKKHKTTPAPLFWVPVGKNLDEPFLESIATLGGGKVVPKSSIQELSRYYKVQETIGCVYKMVRKHKDVYSSDQQIMTMINALAGNVLETEEKKYILEEVQKKQKDPETESTDALDFDGIYEDEEDKILLRLGTRVRRGPNWKWNDQDSEGVGTVVQHRKKRDGWLRVMWDNGNHNAYRCGDGECFDVKEVDEPRLVDGPDQIDIGVRVVRGSTWKNGDEDGQGKGIVLRKRRDNKVRVRWENGYIGKYRFDDSGSSDVQIDPSVIRSKPSPQGSSSSKPTSAEEQGAVGGADPEQVPGPGERYIWEWKDPSDSQWKQYEPLTQDKLLSSFNRGVQSCVIERGNLSRRILFKHNQEKTVDGRGGGGLVPVQKKVISNEEYMKMSKGI